MRHAMTMPATPTISANRPAVRAWRACGHLSQIPRSPVGKICFLIVRHG
jgi:hypothetical protein